MLKNFLGKFKTLLFSLRFSILSIFIACFLIITGTIIVVMTIFFSREITFTALELMKHASDTVLKELSTGMKPAEVNAQFSANVYKSGIFDTDKELMNYIYQMLKTMPLVTAIYWADEQGKLLLATKNLDGTITTRMYQPTTIPQSVTITNFGSKDNIISVSSYSKVDFDPRQRFWYKDAKLKKQSIWTDAFKSYLNPYHGISRVTPVLDNSGKLIGNFGFDISIDYLKNFLAAKKISPNSYAFIIDRKGEIVVYPNQEPFLSAEKNSQENIDVKKFPLIQDSFNIYKEKSIAEMRINYGGKNYLVTYKPIDQMPQGWVIGVVTPENDFIGLLRNLNYVIFILCLLILGLGILLVSNLITRTVRPINTLVREADKIRRFDLRGKINFKSRIKEVVELRNAMRAMKLGLMHFQKYVPKILVRQLIESGEDIRVGGERKNLVVMFTDIENFTTIAEKVEPSELTIQVCEYFEELTQIIIEEKGTIDKYIGDSIMAFWGAPIPQYRPIDHAAKAALRCEQKMDELNQKWKREGKPQFITRIGIHMGEAIVGNLGSTERLNYTAIGDVINTTSRLEHINKFYQTKIMVTEDIYQQLKNRFVFRKVDFVTFTGKTGKIYIYELLSDDPSKLNFNITAYNEAFEKAYDAYQDEKWDEAIKYFQECLMIYPEDVLAPHFIERCEEAQRLKRS